MEPTALTELMMQAARDLEDQVDPASMLQAAVDIAVREVDGCESAAVTIVRKAKKPRAYSPAWSGEAARRADMLQYDLGEGPCLDASWGEPFVHSPDLANDPRWPAWGPRAAVEAGVRSMMAFQLFTAQHTLGALNLYSSRVHGMEVADRDHGSALATHAAVALRSSQRIADLSIAVESRTLIGTAVGLIMGRYDLDQTTAFTVLTRLSSETNTKLRDVAEQVIETRGLPSRRTDDQGPPGGDRAVPDSHRTSRQG